MKLVILDADTLGDGSLDAISSMFDEVVIHPHTPPDLCLSRLTGATVAVTNKVAINKDMMAALPTLKLICVAATGTDQIDKTAAKKHGIVVCNVPAYSTQSVAAQTFALYFHLAHHNRYYDEYTRSGNWCASPVFTHLGRPFSELAGQTWGIIGLGQIGRAVAAAAVAFGCQVVYHSASGRNQNQPFPHRTLADLLDQADVVSIHAPLNDNTRGLIGADQLRAMKPNAILLNLGRGGIIDEAALATALDQGHIAAAGLDVLSQEPPPADHPLFQLQHPERLFLTPHIAWTSRQARGTLIQTLHRNIEAFLAGNPQNLV